jgi:hypothetical protein
MTYNNTTAAPQLHVKGAYRPGDSAALGPVRVVEAVSSGKESR